MSVLDQSVKNVIGALEGVDADFQALLEEERAGKNRKSMIAWLEEQDAQGSEIAPELVEEEPPETTDVSMPDVEPVYVAPTWEDGGEMSIATLISGLCQKRDELQRSTSCGVENIRVSLSEIKISVR